MTDIKKICEEVIGAWKDNNMEIIDDIGASATIKLARACFEMIKALEDAHKVLQNRQYEEHVFLTSHPAQNGCLVYSEWKLKAVKEKALQKVREIFGENN